MMPEQPELEAIEPEAEPEIPDEPGLLILDLTQEADLLPARPAAGQDSGTGERGDGKRAGKSREAKPPPPLPTGAPTAAEWQDFLGCTVLRLLTQAYLHLVLFREVDESDLTPRELELISLDKEDLKDIAAPMATVAAKNKIARRHGRQILALSASYESVIDLLIWARRVSKIAKKYRGTHAPAEEGVTEGVIFDGPVPGSYVQEGPVIVNRGTG